MTIFVIITIEDDPHDNQDINHHDHNDNHLDNNDHHDNHQDHLSCSVDEETSGDEVEDAKEGQHHHHCNRI